MCSRVTGFALVLHFFPPWIDPVLSDALLSNIAFVFKYFDILRAPKPIEDFHFNQFYALKRRTSLEK